MVKICCASTPLSPCARHLSFTQEQVRESLDSLLYSSQRTLASQLLELFLVDLFLWRHDLPCDPTNRHYALQTILLDHITHQLAAHRRVVDLRIPDTSESFAEAILSIQADARLENPELTGWSWLYYRYARTDLNLSPTLFSQLAHVEARTLRRYQHNSIARLTSKLIHQESEARSVYRQRRLLGNLPVAAPIRLYGRDKEMAWVKHLLKADPPIHLQINGAKGIGKSAFVQEIVRQQIDAGAVDYLIWIERPESVQTIYQQVAPILSFRASALNCQLIMVLDDIEGLRSELHSLESLLDDLSTEVVYLINRSYVPLKNVDCYNRLDELNYGSVTSFVASLMARCSFSEAWGHLDDVVHEVWERARGNPGAIRSAIQQSYLSETFS